MEQACRKIACLAAGGATAVGLFGVLGWITGWFLLASFRSTFIPMAPLSGTLFILLGLGLWLYAWRPKSPACKSLAFSMSFVTLLIALLKLIEFSHRLHFGWEEALVRNPAAFGLVPTARMSPITAAFFVGSGLALTAIVRNYRSAAGVLASGVLLLDGVVLLGYLYGTPLLYGGTIIPVALTTSLAFFWVGIGLLAAAGPEEIPLRWVSGRSTHALLLRTFLPVSLLTLVVSALFYRFLPWSLNPALLAALSALLSGPVITLLVSRVALQVGGDLERAEEALRQSNARLTRAYDSTLEGWSRALDLRDKETEGHCQRVTETTVRLAQMLGLSDEDLIHIHRGALLHDIGKMGLPDRVLLKAGQLTEEEWGLMRQHPAYAHRMLGSIDYLRPALDIPFCHHEHWNGGGYPRGLKGEEIPFAARIFSVVDIWDALISDRPYKKGWPEEKVREHLKSLAGTQLDPRVVEAFLRMDLSSYKRNCHANDDALAA